MNIWYSICQWTSIEMLQWDFMCNALLAVILLAPLLGLCSTMVVTGKMSFFSDALGHSAFTGIAIGSIFGIVAPTWAAVIFSVVFAMLFSYVHNRSTQAADTLIGVFSSTAVALGIFIATLGGNSFTKYNSYLIGDILSVTPTQIGLLLLILFAVLVFWCFASNRTLLSSIHPQLASSRGIPTGITQAAFTVIIAIVVTLAISWVGLLILNSLLILPAAAARNIAKNLKQYQLISILFALISGIIGLCLSYLLGVSAGAAISLTLSLFFAVSFILKQGRS